MTDPGKRVAVVGGGMAGLSLAWCLSADPSVEITVYQLGWRLGGKLASSRRVDGPPRIEEHGLHVWSGFYENAFWMMQDVYRAIGDDRPLVGPNSDSWFTPLVDIAWFTSLGSQHAWVRSANELPLNDVVPGTTGRLGTPAVLMARVLTFAVQFLAAYRGDRRWPNGGRRLSAATIDEVTARFAEIGNHLEADHSDIAEEHGGWLVELRRKAETLDTVCRSVHAWVDDATGLTPWMFEALAFVDLAAAYLRGFLRDGVFTEGFAAIGGQDLREWLDSAGAHRFSTGSGFIRGVYSYLFAYEDGDPKRPRLDAGVGMRMMLRLLLASSTSSFLRMNGGAGEVVVAPLYLALRRRGVRFEFFHKLSAVLDTGDSRAIAGLRFGRQARAISSDGYEPLIAVDGRRCWPSEPRYDQLVDGDALRDRHIDLESDWVPDDAFEPVTLERGVDFDHVVLAMPPAALSRVLPPRLCAASPGLQSALTLPSVATLGLQAWFDSGPNEIFRAGAGGLASAYATPLDTFADMSHLVELERWPPGDAPRSLLYLCGPVPLPRDNPTPAAIRERAMAQAVEWMEHDATRAVPGAFGSDGVFAWSTLHGSAAGAARLAEQFLSVNVNASALYCQAPDGAEPRRPTPDGTGVDGLTVVGDWVRTGLGYGCIESAVMAGFAGAGVISGTPLYIYGASDFEPFDPPGPWTTPTQA
jgi:uncharacterized protein with NAD-binding domain and iron-sulfur cluster